MAKQTTSRSSPALVHDDPLIHEHISQLATLKEQAERAESDRNEHHKEIKDLREMVITIRADIRASRYIIVTAMALIGVVLAFLQLLWGK